MKSQNGPESHGNEVVQPILMVVIALAFVALLLLLP